MVDSELVAISESLLYHYDDAIADANPRGWRVPVYAADQPILPVLIFVMRARAEQTMQAPTPFVSRTADLSLSTAFGTIPTLSRRALTMARTADTTQSEEVAFGSAVDDVHVLATQMCTVPSTKLKTRSHRCARRRCPRRKPDTIRALDAKQDGAIDNSCNRPSHNLFLHAINLRNDVLGVRHVLLDLRGRRVAFDYFGQHVGQHCIGQEKAAAKRHHGDWVRDTERPHHRQRSPRHVARPLNFAPTCVP